MSNDTSQTIKIPLSKTGKHKGLYTATVDGIDTDLGDFSWHIKFGTRSNAKYAMRASPSSKGKKDFIHRVIMERILGRKLKRTELVDHINGDGLDNRRDNLRVATPAENNANSTTNKNSVGYKGVDFHKHTQKYRARIKVNYKSIHLGLFDTPEEAHQAYCKAAHKYFGDFARFD